MKKKISMGIVFLATVMSNAAFGQNRGKYYLEIWNISKATYDTINKKNSDPAWVREDSFILARTANGTTLRSKDKNLSLEEARLKLLAIDTKKLSSDLTNMVNSNLRDAQQKWTAAGMSYIDTQYTVFWWLRRTE